MKAEIMATNECGLLMLPPADGPVGVVGVEGVEQGVVDVVGQASKASRSFR